jgi:hypothetical protein
MGTDRTRLGPGSGPARRGRWLFLMQVIAAFVLARRGLNPNHHDPAMTAHLAVRERGSNAKRTAIRGRALIAREMS